MEIKFADTFIKSLQNIADGKKWYHWRFYREKYYDLRSFLKSFFTYSYKSTMIKDWQFDTIFPLMKLHLEKLCYILEYHGMEVDETRLPKIAKIKRTIKLLDYYIKSDYVEQAENQLFRNVSYHNLFDDARTAEQKEKDAEIYALSVQIELEQLNELWNIICSDARGWWD